MQIHSREATVVQSQSRNHFVKMQSHSREATLAQSLKKKLNMQSHSREETVTLRQHLTVRFSFDIIIFSRYVTITIKLYVPQFRENNE